jgi:heme A synthase
VKDVHIVVGVLAIALNTLAGLYGAWRWWRVRPSRWFWRLLRPAQAVIVLQAALGGILVAMGKRPPGLHVVYGLLPLAVSFIAEQLRVVSAQMILDARGFESAQDVGRLPEAEQKLVALSIVQREIGVMVLAALVNVVLLARAAGTAG